MSKSYLLYAAIFCIATPALAQQRTVSWYAANPVERQAMRRVCLNDPGRLRNHPDCINASQGELNAALQSRRVAPNNIPRSMTSYWAMRPAERDLKLRYCAMMTPVQQARSEGCVTAQQAMPSPLLASRR